MAENQITEREKEIEIFGIALEDLEGKIVLSCGSFPHADGEQITPEQKRALDELHLRKIDLSNFIYVIDVGGYIGESTKREIEYAKKHNKKIYYDSSISDKFN